MKRTQWLLTAALAIQLALVFLVRSPFSSASAPEEATPLLPSLEAITPARVELESDDESIALVRGDGGWTIPSLEGFPADQTKIEGLVDSLTALEVRRPIVRSERYHDAFHVSEDDPESLVRIWDDRGDDPDVELFVGSSSNYRTVNVRRGDGDEVYEVRELATYELRPTKSSWIRKELIDAPPQEQVDRLVLDNVNGRLELAKRDGTWTVVAPESAAGTAIDASRVDALISAASGLRLADAVGPRDPAAHGLEKPAATLLLGWSGGGGEGSASSGEVTIEVGAPVADNGSQRYVSRQGFGFTGTVWESSVKRLLEDDLDSLSAAKS